MAKMKQSIGKRITLFAIPLALLLVFLISGVIHTITVYSSTMKYYMGFYNVLAAADSSLAEYDIAMRGGQDATGASDYIVDITTKHNQLKEAVRELYSYRFRVDNDVRFRIERINSDMFLIEEFMTAAIEQGRPDVISSMYVKDMQEIMSVFNVKMSECKQITAKYITDKGVRAMQGDGSIKILLIIGLAVFVILIVWMYIFLQRRVASPIKDVYEWSRAFEKSYGEMNDLTWEHDDEIGRIKESFNIVKNKLNYANALSDEYATAMKKLKSEEEYKEKFVKQLYDEKRDKEAISTAAKRDGLTGLYNRRTFDDLVNDFLYRRVPGSEAALFLIDMDNFKNVNDSLGHLSGDDALKMLAGAMRVALPDAHLGRYGGDEFTALLTGNKSDEEIKAAAALLCSKMRVDFTNDGKTVPLSVSIGIAKTDEVSSYSELYMKADRALYFSKENGRNQYKLESELEESDIAE